MQKGTTLREASALQTNECITSLAVSAEYIAAGCLQDNLFLWSADVNTKQRDTTIHRKCDCMGIIDVKFNERLAMLAASAFDSTIRLWDITTDRFQSIQCQVMENWKVEFFDNSIVTCGDLGKITFYDYNSKQKLQQCQLGEIFLTSMAISHQSPVSLLAAGNNNGDLYLMNLQRRTKIACFKPHFKIIRAVQFIDNKVITASDDNSLKIIDVPSQKIIGVLQGHKEAVSGISAFDKNLMYTCSFDKTIKLWDLRLQQAVALAVTGNPLWDCKVNGKNLITGGENGVLSIFTLA